MRNKPLVYKYFHLMFNQYVHIKANYYSLIFLYEFVISKLIENAVFCVECEAVMCVDLLRRRHSQTHPSAAHHLHQYHWRCHHHRGWQGHHLQVHRPLTCLFGKSKLMLDNVYFLLFWCRSPEVVTQRCVKYYMCFYELYQL